MDIYNRVSLKDYQWDKKDLILYIYKRKIFQEHKQGQNFKENILIKMKLKKQDNIFV